MAVPASDHLTCPACGWQGRLSRLRLGRRILPGATLFLIGSVIACHGYAWHLSGMPVHPLDQPLIDRGRLVLVATGILGLVILGICLPRMRRMCRPAGSVCVRCGSTAVTRAGD